MIIQPKRLRDRIEAASMAKLNRVDEVDRVKCVVLRWTSDREQRLECKDTITIDL